jgi:hypothetical protein
LILIEAVTLSVFRPWEEWANVMLRAWLIVSPWVLGVLSRVAVANFTIVGVAVLLLAIFEMRSSEVH